jgi:hypothetical protein
MPGVDGSGARRKPDIIFRARICLNPAMRDTQIPETGMQERTMVRLKSLLVAAPLAAGLLAAPMAHADWHGRGGWHGGPGWHGGYHHDRGPGVAGAILGLGAAAIIGGVIASQEYQPPPVVYAPPPAYYAPPPPAYYPPPPPPGYYPGY